MGLRFRKSIKVGPARINLSKSGVGYSVGTKGLRVTKKANGGTRTTASIPGTGISYVKDSSKKKSTKSSTSQKKSVNSATQANSAKKRIGCLPALGIFFLIALLIGLLRTYPVITILVLLLIAAGAFYIIHRKKAKKAALSEDVNPDQEAAPAQPASESEFEERRYHVAGVEYYLDNLRSLMEHNYLYDYKKQELIDTCHTNESIYKETVTTDQLELVPEPSNPHDRNAVQVLLGGKLVGYIPATSCEHVLEVLKNGRIISLTFEVEGGKYKMVDEDYDSIKDKSTYKMETGEDPYGINIYIREKL